MLFPSRDSWPLFTKSQRIRIGRLGIGGDLSDQGLVDGETKRRHFCGELLLYCVRDVVLETGELLLELPLETGESLNWL